MTRAGGAVHTPGMTVDLATFLAAFGGLAVLIVGLFAWLRADMWKIRAELRGEMNALREEMRGEMKALREEMREEMRKLDVRLTAVEHDLIYLRGLIEGLRESVSGRAARADRDAAD